MSEIEDFWEADSDDIDEAVLALIDAGADVNVHEEHGWTPLMMAAQTDSLAAVEALIEVGADATARDAYGHSAMEWAKSSEMRQLLARAWPQDHPHRLHALAKADLADEVVDAVAAGADVNARDEKGQTPLFWAIEDGSLAAIEVLIEAGADVDMRNRDDQTPLFCASMMNNMPFAEVLIKAGADVNARDEKGRTPLFWAIEDGSLAVAKVLIKAGADVTIRDSDGQGALDRACSPEMHQLLTRAWPQDHPLRLHALATAE